MTAPPSYHFTANLMRLSRCEHAVNLRDDASTFPYRRRDTLGRARAHIPNSKNAGQAGLKRQDRAGIRGHTGQLGAQR